MTGKSPSPTGTVMNVPAAIANPLILRVKRRS
jgi:hypothetical protein